MRKCSPVAHVCGPGESEQDNTLCPNLESLEEGIILVHFT